MIARSQRIYMDLRREKKHRPFYLIVCILVILILAVLAGISSLLIQSKGAQGDQSKADHASSSNENLKVVESDGIDPLAESGPVDEESPFEGEDSAGYFFYRLNAEPYFPSGGKAGTVKIENPKENTLLMMVEYQLSQTGEVIYRSGYLSPGNHIDQAPLSVELGDGKYDVIAHIYALNPEDQAVIADYQAEVVLTVGENE